MKIAIVTLHSVPFAIGGAENLWWGLQRHFQEETPHSCDIISLVVSEDSFWNLIDAYRAFSELDLSAYDCIITGKYPAWMVKHPNHVCYLLHRLRGLYDTYQPGANDSAVLDNPQIRGLVKWMDDATTGGEPADDDHIAELFQKLQQLREAGLPDELFTFPGPLIRMIVHFLDNAALAPSRIRRFAAISATVRDRKFYFPEDALVAILHIPPHRDDYREGEGRYLFTSSRLDRPKRIDLIIEAMKHVKAEIPLLIAGTGPDEARLRALAADDKRIRFLGYVADEDMPALYADALAVPFVPHDEDYGLVTIEAMRSAKPVLTVTDSGGPCELIRDGETGHITSPTPEALAKAITALAADPDHARQMGLSAKEAAATITWGTVSDGLLSTAAGASSRMPIRPKLTVATTFRVFPPVGGGQARVFHLYKNLARTFDIDIVSLGSVTDSRSEDEIAPGLVEICIPQSDRHAEVERQISQRLNYLPITDIAAHTLVGLTPDYVEALELSAISSKAVIACHPYLVQTIRKAAPERPLWYEAQDVEISLKTSLLSGLEEADILLEQVRSVERESWLSAARVFACANRDIDELNAIYGPTRARLHEVPNGVAIDEIPYTSLQRRRHLKRLAGLDGKPMVIFMGSWHGPNLEAIENILLEAPNAPNTRFVIMGSAGLPFKDRKIPANVDLLGAVDQRTRNDLLSMADAALNPMFSGSGTNLKMLDYFAAGIPVISTSFGARGLLIENGTHFITAENEHLIAAIDCLMALNDDQQNAMIFAARALVEEHYSWKVIADRFLAALADTGFDL